MYLIRRAALSDVGSMAYVHATSWQETYKGLLADHIINRYNEENRKKMWSDFLQNEGGEQCAYVAVNDSDKIVGIASWRETANQVELLTLYVLSEFQCQGIGKSLFNQVEKDTDEKNKPLITWVLKKNSAVLFYEKMGLKCIKSEEKNLGDMQVEELMFCNRL